MRICEECGRPHAEKHHIIFKSHMKGLEAAWNYKYLCPDHHRGNNSPHRNKSIDDKYKQEVQLYLLQTLTKDYYNIWDIEELLQLNTNSVLRIVKTLQIQKEGYAKEDIIMRIMGMNYLE